ncbi:MAG: DUF4190 domain-containing protein [Clostridia bacterium]|nr:DUF4190 domain-containing protein [Clostridia bacterium]
MRYCPNCGASNADDAKFCTSCGKQLQEQPTVQTQSEVNQENVQPAVQPTMQPTTNMQPVVQTKYSGKAIVSFVLSLVGIFVAAIICGSLGIIFSAIAIQEINNQKTLKGKGLAIAGLVISIIDVVLVALYYFA